MPLETLKEWHKLVESNDAAGLDNLLADDAVLHSPIVHRPIDGKYMTKMYLTAAMHVLNNDSFFKVMVRPLKAISLVHSMMGSMLERLGKA